MRKILFLDVDGVLNTPTMTSGRLGADLGKEHMRKLAMIIHAAKCDVVISSSWRHYPEYMAELEAAFAEFNLPKWVDVTPYVRNGERKDEIWQWLKENNGSAIRAVIIDDESDARLEAFDRNLTVSFIKTDMDVGLTDDHVKLILWLFKEEKQWNATR
jgi:hypothetical protein